METLNYNLTTRVMEALGSPEGKLAQIELLVGFAAFLLIFLEVFGTFRRCYSNEILRSILSIAYTLSPFLVVYTIGLVNAAPFKNEHFLIWVAFLIILFGSADSFSAHTLEDNEQWKKYKWQYLIKIMGLLVLQVMYLAVASVSLSIATYILYFLISMKFLERLIVSEMASKASLQMSLKMIADYTRREHLVSNQDGEVDLTTMKGYTYLVKRVRVKWGTSVQGLIRRCFGMKEVVEGLEAKAPEYHVPLNLEPEDIITVEKVWQCQGKLLKEGDLDHRIKDICLSYGLFHILSSRLAGYSMPQEVYQKSWKLFQKIINDGNERVFRLIEEELAFVFYRCYTKYLLHTSIIAWVMKLIKLVLTTLSLIAVASTVVHYRTPEDNVRPITLNGLNIDVLVTTMAILGVLILEILQLVLIIFSECGKVFWICAYVNMESWHKQKYIEKLIKFVCHTELLKPWERKLRQYSLLESYGYSPPLLLYNGWTKFVNEGQKQSNPTELSTEVKSAVINSLLIGGSKLKNGKTSLIRNMMPQEEYSWACNLETQAQVIMVWHIATSMCEYEFPATSNTVFLKNYKIATGLSKYLAYLVAFVPRLLPDHPCVTEYVFKQVIIEARFYFKRCNSLEDKIKELKDNCSREGESETVIHRGARLGKKLLDVNDNVKVWKVLADFWAELMLYVAPSDDMDAHATHLSMGGEFITQIWALLLHSGIGRDTRDGKAS